MDGSLYAHTVTDSGLTPCHFIQMHGRASLAGVQNIEPLLSAFLLPLILFLRVMHDFR